MALVDLGGGGVSSEIPLNRSPIEMESDMSGIRSKGGIADCGVVLLRCWSIGGFNGASKLIMRVWTIAGFEKAAWINIFRVCQSLYAERYVSVGWNNSINIQVFALQRNILSFCPLNIISKYLKIANSVADAR